MKTWTVNAIQEANRAAGFHWFDPDTMRTFGTRVLPTVYQGPGGIYFVTSDSQYSRELPRRCTVRRFDHETATIETVGDVASLTKREAVKTAKRAAIGRQPGNLVEPEAGGIPYELRGLRETTEAHRPVTVLEQFTADLCAHCGRAVPSTVAAELMSKARLHHTYMEAKCNGTFPYARHQGEGEPGVVSRCEAKIAKLAAEAGAAGVVFSGDPRGCTVKLTFADGFTNDFGREGYCVPTRE